MSVACKLDFSNRPYNSQIGNFTQKDPIGFSGGDINQYRYVGNNPVNFVDPSGLLLENAISQYLTPGQQAAVGTVTAAAGVFLVRMAVTTAPAAAASGAGLFGSVAAGTIGAALIYEGSVNAAEGGRRQYHAIPQDIEVLTHTNYLKLVCGK